MSHTLHNLRDKGLRYQAQAIFDRGARHQNYDTTHTSRPDAVPTWDDITEDEQDDVIRQLDESGLLYEYLDTGVPWHGSVTAVIESQTNPWLEGSDGPIQLDVLIGTLGEHPGHALNDCSDCGGLLPGVLNMDTEYGIQRCDSCNVWLGDLDAAAALRDAYFPDAIVWFHGTN